MGCHFLLQGNLSNPEIEPTSSALADKFLKLHGKLTHMRRFYIRCSQKHPRIASLPKGTNQSHKKENLLLPAWSMALRPGGIVGIVTVDGVLRLNIEGPVKYEFWIIEFFLFFLATLCMACRELSSQTRYGQ